MKEKNNAQMVQAVPRLLAGGKPPRFYESLRGSKLAQNRGLGAEYIGQSWSLADEEKTRESSC